MMRIMHKLNETVERKAIVAMKLWDNRSCSKRHGDEAVMLRHYSKCHPCRELMNAGGQMGYVTNAQQKRSHRLHLKRHVTKTISN